MWERRHMLVENCQRPRKHANRVTGYRSQRSSKDPYVQALNRLLEVPKGVPDQYRWLPQGQRSLMELAEMLRPAQIHVAARLATLFASQSRRVMSVSYVGSAIRSWSYGNISARSPGKLAY